MKRISKILNIKNLLTAAVVLLGMTGCKDEIIVQDTDNAWKDAVEQRGEGMFHMAFRLKMASDGPTRAADGFVDGDPDSEGKIDNIMFLFFDKDGNQLDSATGSNITSLKHEEKEDADKDDIEYEFNTLAAVSLGDNPDNYQAMKDIIQSIDSFFVIVNYDTNWTFKKADDSKMSLKEVKEFTDDKCRVVSSESSAYIHRMTSAGYYDENGNYYFYYKKPANQQIFFETKNAAKENPVTTYVERVGARVDLTVIKDVKGIKAFYGENQFGTDIYELYFEPNSWGVSATGKNTYLAKDLGPKSEYSVPANGYDSGFYPWIHQENYYHRAFWSKSTCFYEDKSVKYTSDGTEDNTQRAQLSLNYLRYSEIDGIFLPGGEDEYGHEILNTLHAYLLERTFDSRVMVSADNPNAVATSIVVYGTYSSKCVGSDKRNPDGTEPAPSTVPVGTEIDLSEGFYMRDVDMERVGTGNEEIKYRLYLRKNKSKGEDDLYNAMLNEQYTVWIPKRNEQGVIEKGKDGMPLAYEQPVRAADKYNPDIFVVNNTYKYWNGEDLVPSPNQYTLQLKDWDKIQDALTALKNQYGLEYELYFGKYNASANEHHDMVKLTEGNLKDANETIQKTIGAAQFYKNAHAFFYSPIPHYNINTYTGYIKYKPDGLGGYEKINKKYVPNHFTGDFGVVRNHIYNLTVYSFSTLGYGQPEGYNGELDNIVLPEPRIGREQEQFDIKLEIIPWNEFNYTFDL